MSSPTIFERIGGAEGVHKLVRRFYDLMDRLPEAYAVRQLHPQDLHQSAKSLQLFLSGWFGGPPLYSEQRGHPRLRMRHMPYRISKVERDEWMMCMNQALDEQLNEPKLKGAILGAFSSMADHMINTAASE